MPESSYAPCSVGQLVLSGLSQKFGFPLKEDKYVQDWVGKGSVSLPIGRDDPEGTPTRAKIVLLKSLMSQLCKLLSVAWCQHDHIGLLMNQSGGSVKKAMTKYTGRHLNHSQLIVLYDSIRHPVMNCSVKYQGFAKGHSGVRSCINYMGSMDNFMRMGLNIGKSESRNTAEYLLEQLPPDEESFWKGEGTEVVWDIILRRILELQSQMKDNNPLGKSEDRG